MPEQLIPLPVTEPEPEPASATERVRRTGANVAETFWSELMVTVHVPVAPQPPPDQPVNVDPAAGAADNVTAVPGG